MTAARSERSDHGKPRSDKLLLEQLRDRAPGREEPSRDSGSEKAIFHIKRDGCSGDCIHHGTRGCEFLAVPENSIQGIHEDAFLRALGRETLHSLRAVR
jgi:hypothetical protein